MFILSPGGKFYDGTLINRVAVENPCLESIYPNYPEEWLADNHFVGSIAGAQRFMALSTQPGYCLELCGDHKENDKKYQLYSIQINIKKKQ